MSSKPSESLNSPLSCACSLPAQLGVLQYEADVESFLYTQLGGGHTSHRVPSIHRALDQLPAEHTFSTAEWGDEPKVTEGHFQKPPVWVNPLGSNADRGVVLKGATLALNCAAAIRELFYLCMLHYDTLCVNKREALSTI